MSNQELFKQEINQQITSVKTGENGLVLKLAETTLTFTHEHEQDCCENVFADFSPMEDHADQLDNKFLAELIIKGVDEMGFLLCFILKQNEDNHDYTRESLKVFIPCYNEQNGYYSDDLTLVIELNNTKTTIDISGFVEDNID